MTRANTTHHQSEPAFIPGLRLGELFYQEAVAPLLAAAFPGLRHSAALIGYGSELFGFDTARSTDHNWGPRLLLFLADEDHAAHAVAIDALLGERLPPLFRGYSTHFSPPGPDGARVLGPRAGGRIDHGVEIAAPRPWLTARLGIDPFPGLTAVDWLLLPQQRLLEVTAGRVYHDGLGTLEPLRATLAWYPRAVWLSLIAAQWARLAEQEAFVGRAGEVGDETGSALIAADLVRDLMRLGFLYERRYAPYSKWVGTAFARLACAPRLQPLFRRVLLAATWPERESPLCQAYEVVAAMHNALAITPPLDPRVRPFHERPFRVLDAGRFTGAIVAAIDDPEVLAIVERAGAIGAVDQISDNVVVKSSPERFTRLRALYG